MQHWSNMQRERWTNILNLWTQQERKSVEGRDAVERDKHGMSGGACRRI